MAEVTYVPDGNQANNILPWMLAGNNGWGNGLFGGAGGGAFFGALLGSIFPNLFGWNGGFGGNFGGNGAAAALGAQATANNNTELIMNAINGTDSDIRLLATTLNGDVDSIRLAINSVQGAIQTVGAQLGLTGQQVINAIQSGNADIASRICQCCCENKLLVTSQGYENQIRTIEQTNTLGSAINANGQRTVDAIADLKATMIQSFCDVKEREMQNKIDSLTAANTTLRNEADNARQTNMISAMLAPIAKEVDDIKCKLPSTTSVVWPNLTAVNTTPYVSGGYYGNGFGFFGNGITF